MGAQPGLRGAISSCEVCGLGVVGQLGSSEEALEVLGALLQDGKLRFINWGGFSAAFGGGGWAGLQPRARFLFTAEAVKRLLGIDDQIVKKSRWSPASGVAITWQTLINSLTFGRNDALAAFGRAEATRATKPWQRRIDALISLALAIPALLVALPIELCGAAFGRSGAISMRIESL